MMFGLAHESDKAKTSFYICKRKSERFVPLQVFSKCAQVRDTVGLANSGISSCVAKDMHKKQGIYGTAAMA